MRITIALLLFVVLLPLSTATLFTQLTTVHQGDISYIFSKGIEIDSFRLFNGGIIIDEEYRFSIGIQGGELDVFIYEWEGLSSKFGFKSNVPQTLSLNIIVKGQQYYLYDGETYSLDSYRVETDMINWTIEILGSIEEKELVNEDSIADKITRQEWYQKKLLEFELSAEVNENGIVTGDTVSITYFWAVVGLIIIVITVSWLWKRKK